MDHRIADSQKMLLRPSNHAKGQILAEMVLAVAIAYDMTRHAIQHGISDIGQYSPYEDEYKMAFSESHGTLKLLSRSNCKLVPAFRRFNALIVPFQHALLMAFL